MYPSDMYIGNAPMKAKVDGLRHHLAQAPYMTVRQALDEGFKRAGAAKISAPISL